MDFVQRPTTPAGGFTFQAHPTSAKEPAQRLMVRTPYQKNIPPLMKCARPFNNLSPRYTQVSSLQSVIAFFRAGTYENSTISHNTRGKRKKGQKNHRALDYGV
jgi:hypothetical protein